MNRNTLIEAFYRLNNRACTGVDNVTIEEYKENLGSNIKILVERLKKGAFKPKPVKRIYIPKDGKSSQRPIGIPALEDKIVQGALTIILEAIYEEDFLNLSFGFRPKRSQHDALKKLSEEINKKKINYIVDADIKGFFDNVSHEWIMKFLKHRIADTKILALIKRFLKAGIMEDGIYVNQEEGVPQGGNLSPLISNIYLHYVIDLWFEKIVNKHCKGDASIVRYADDSVACFQYKHEAEAYYKALISRLKKFELDISIEKSKIIEFGRFAEQRRKEKGKSRPETFDFLGITHFCGKSRAGNFKLKWKTSRKKFCVKINKFKRWIKESRNNPIKEIWKSVNSKLIGHYNYYGVSDNWSNLIKYKRQVIKLLFYWLGKRSQRKSLNWNKFNNILKSYHLANPKPGSLINLNPSYT
jgi:group II intron reverse transcriptase/maturase